MEGGNLDNAANYVVSVRGKCEPEPPVGGSAQCTKNLGHPTDGMAYGGSSLGGREWSEVDIVRELL